MVRLTASPGVYADDFVAPVVGEVYPAVQHLEELGFRQTMTTTLRSKGRTMVASGTTAYLTQSEVVFVGKDVFHLSSNTKTCRNQEDNPRT